MPFKKSYSSFEKGIFDRIARKGDSFAWWPPFLVKVVKTVRLKSGGLKILANDGIQNVPIHLDSNPPFGIGMTEKQFLKVSKKGNMILISYYECPKIGEDARKIIAYEIELAS